MNTTVKIEYENEVLFTGSLEDAVKVYDNINSIDDLIQMCKQCDCVLTVKDDFGHERIYIQGLIVVGYANKTAFHPVGSYIGFEPGPTVFATPLTYLDGAVEQMNQVQDALEELEGKVNHQQLVIKQLRQQLANVGVSSVKIYKVENGNVFEGTVEQAQDCFLSNADDTTIREWCTQNNFSLEVYDLCVD